MVLLRWFNVTFCKVMFPFLKLFSFLKMKKYCLGHKIYTQSHDIALLNMTMFLKSEASVAPVNNSSNFFKIFHIACWKEILCPFKIRKVRKILKIWHLERYAWLYRMLRLVYKYMISSCYILEGQGYQWTANKTGYKYWLKCILQLQVLTVEKIWAWQEQTSYSVWNNYKPEFACKFSCPLKRSSLPDW